MHSLNLSCQDHDASGCITRIVSFHYIQWEIHVSDARGEVDHAHAWEQAQERRALFTLG
jgi:hypothetical protein